MSDDILDIVRTKFGSDIAFRLNEPGRVANVKFIPTSIATVDFALGGGVPAGRIIEIFGPEASGKSALACAIIGSLQQHGYGALFVDMEYSLQPEHAKSNGVDIDSLILSQPTDAETAMGLIEYVLRTSKQPMVVVLDSVAALITQDEVGADPGSAMVGKTARLMSQMMRKLAGPTSMGDHVLIFTNQLRMKIGVMFGNPETTTGGLALKFYSSIRINMLTKRWLKEKDETVGMTARMRIVKNKVAPPFKEEQFDIRFDGGGIDKVAATVDVATKLDIIKKAGNGSHYYPYDADTRFAKSRDDAVEHLKKHTLVYDEIYKAVSERIIPPVIEVPQE